MDVHLYIHLVIKALRTFPEFDNVAVQEYTTSMKVYPNLIDP
jgi:hypothetical protein